jgi:hypothetical protein
MVDQVNSIDPVTGQLIIETNNYVWDPIGLAWVKETQPGGGGGGGGPATIADGADVTQGAIADAAVSTDAAGTVNAHLRGLVKLLAAPLHAIIDSSAAIAVTIAAALDVSDRVARLLGHVSLDSGGTLKGQTTMANSLPVVVASDQTGLPVTNANLDVALSTRLKPADTLAAVTAVTAITNALPAGTNRIGSVRPVDSADADLTSAKGTQTARALGVQRLHDAGRNQTNYFMAAPIITTVAEVMQTLTGYKGGVAVVATATPAVVTAGKTYRITRVVLTYWAATVIGGALIRLRANLTGVGVVGSSLVVAWQVGMPAIFTAGAAMTYPFDYPEGLEFAAGTGIAVGVIGEGADGVTGTITGKVMVAIEGYEY